MALRDYQREISIGIDTAMVQGHSRIMAVCPTGGGKTHLISHRAMMAGCQTADIAHRQELVYQIAMALARDGIYHRIMAPDNVANYIIGKQVKVLGRNYVSPDAHHTVVSVDTLLARHHQTEIAKWLRHVGLCQTDEGHHVLADNKWGRALALFPNAAHILWTATPMRADGRSLHADNGGWCTTMVLGPTPADLMARGYLCRYKIFGPKPSIDVGGVTVSKGEFAGKGLRDAAHKSTITGDMLAHWLRFTPGKIGIGFLVDVALARETAERFQAAGVPCAWMSSAETDDRTRVGNIEALARGDLKMIFNVGLFGEGVDIPRVETVADGAPTMSEGSYLQRFGRLLRPFDGKEYGIYVDLAGNVMRHGLPDQVRMHSLDGKGMREKNVTDALTTCTACFQPYPRFKPACPHCGHKATAGDVRRPEQVDGDLTEYSAELLDAMRTKAAELMGPAPEGVPVYVQRNWDARAVALRQLRDAISWWAGIQRDLRGRTDAESYRLFYLSFGIDVEGAKQLGRSQAVDLMLKVQEDIEKVCTRPNGVAPVLVPDEEEVMRRAMTMSPKGVRKEHRAYVRKDGKQIYLGKYYTREEADQVEEDYIKLHNLPPKQIKSPKGVVKKHNATVMKDGKRIKLGKYHTREEADQVEENYRKLHNLPPKVIRSPKGHRKEYRAFVRKDGERIYLGVYDTDEERKQAIARYHEQNARS